LTVAGLAMEPSYYSYLGDFVANGRQEADRTEGHLILCVGFPTNQLERLTPDFNQSKLFLMDSPLITLASAALLAAAAFGGVRIAVLTWLTTVKTSGEPEPKPAELAYLLRQGDMAHTMIVIIVDLVQKAVKAGGAEAALVLEPYEEQVWLNVKGFLKQWASQKLEQHLPVKSRNPFHWLMKLRALKTFFETTVKTVLHGIIKDPRNLRRYFSVAAVGRLALEVYASASKQGVEEQLHKSLTAKGLLIDDQRKQTLAGFLLGLLAAMLVTALSTCLLFGGMSVPQAVLICVSALVNAACLRFLYGLPAVLPFVDDFYRVVHDLPRGGFRFALLRAIFKGARLVLFLALTTIAVLLLAPEALILGGGLFPTAAVTGSLLYFETLLALITITAFMSVAIQLFIDWHAVITGACPSTTGASHLRLIKNRLGHLSPFTALSDVLSNPDYDETLSNLVALYGIETLWLLS
jgi:hypothetical protein